MKNGKNTLLTAALFAAAVGVGVQTAKADAGPEVKSLKENIICTTEDAPISRVEMLFGGLPAGSTVYAESTRNFQTDRTVSVGRLDVPVYSVDGVTFGAALKYTNGVKTKTEEEFGITGKLVGKHGSLILRYFPEGHRVETFGAYSINNKLSVDQLSTFNTMTDGTTFRPAINYELSKDKALRFEASYAGHLKNLKQTYVGAGVQFKFK